MQDGDVARAGVPEHVHVAGARTRERIPARGRDHHDAGVRAARELQEAADDRAVESAAAHDEESALRRADTNDAGVFSGLAERNGGAPESGSECESVGRPRVHGSSGVLTPGGAGGSRPFVTSDVPRG